MTDVSMDKIVALFKRRGFVFPGSELYGGLANTYDYGPMGTEILRNIKNAWWSYFIHERDDVVGIDASTISHQEIWNASGHTASFADALVDCKNCKLRKRVDHLLEDFLEEKGRSLKDLIPETKILSKSDIEKAIETGKVEGWSEPQLEEFITVFHITCPNCKKFDWTPVRKFNQLFPVHLGIVEGEKSLAYLRGETAQGMFINFRNVVDSTRVRLPFGIAQLGKSFRNEITLGNSIFRTIEFDQAEIEYFFDPDVSKWEDLFAMWQNAMWTFVTEKLGVNPEHLRWREHTDEERSFYSKRTADLEYKFPFGYKELWGIAYRTDYDLNQHMKHSGKDLSIVDPQTGKRFVPHVIEPAVSPSRLMLMAMLDSYTEIDDRVVLKLSSTIVPYKVAVFPLLANKDELVTKARAVYKHLKKSMTVAWDDRGNIGKRYAAQDEIGTPYCVTIDFQTLEDNTVTVRNRDTAQQERVSVNDLFVYFK